MSRVLTILVELVYSSVINIDKGGVKLKIKALRESKNMTQEQLADLVGVERAAVAMWETGKSIPRVQTLLKLAKTFNCTIEELVEEK